MKSREVQPRVRFLLSRVLFAVVFFAIACVAMEAESGAPVLMISIDGLKPEYVTHADEHDLRIPTLRRFLSEGSYADGVMPVLPTVTYPSHTTLITGVVPAEHGIVNNQVFDPENKLQGAWYWYAQSILVPTLWDAAHNAGIRTASVSWPVSVNAGSVDVLIPEYWRTDGPGNPQDRYLMDSLSRPAGMLAEMEKRIGPYMEGNDTSVKGDETRTRFAVDILRRDKPGFMTVHLAALDHTEHQTGPFSKQSNEALEKIDGMVKELMQAALANDGRTRIVIVSDHGFLTITHTVNLYIPFLKAGLLQTSKQPIAGGERVAVDSWKAQLWSAGGVVAVMLHDAKDDAAKNQVHTLLTTLAADPANGIDQVLDGKQAEEKGGFPGAAYLIVLKPGYRMGFALSGDVVNVQKKPIGNHGFWPEFPEMRASFFALGSGIAKGRDLGVIDMKQIAPTVAEMLGVKLPTAHAPVLQVNP